MRAFLVTAALAACTGAHAQDFPARRVTVVVAFSAGGPVDVVARVFADRLTQRWGVPVTVENRTGRVAISRLRSSPRRRPTATPCCSLRPASRSTRA
jgi:tripartite-type tricarboxylate transporter receptor subunit TctC